jgi:integrase
MSAALSERVGRVVAYPPLSEMDDRQRQEFQEALLDADGLRDRLDAYLVDGPTDGRIFTGLRECYIRGRDAAVTAEVEPATFHECRHGYASLMIAAGVNVKALSTFMGHVSSRR